jgi:hypothetical protein
MNHADQLLIGTDQPNFLIKIRIVEDIIRIILIFVIIVWLRAPTRYGIIGILWVFVFLDLPANLFKTYMSYRHLNRNIIKIRLSFMQTFGAPFLASAIVYLLGNLFKKMIYDPLRTTHGLFAGLIPFVLCIVVMAIYLYFPLTVVFGGWDDGSIKNFERAAKMSGPSKFLVYPMWILVKKVYPISPLHNRFPIETEDAEREGLELYHLKMQKNAEKPTET